MLSGDVGLDDESADAGTATFEREKDLSIENNVRDLLHKIDRALKRIDDGTYGICDICGKPIEKARMKALPVRRSLHQGRPGAVAAVGAVTRHGRSARHPLRTSRRACGSSTVSTKVWAEQRSRDDRP